MRKKISFLVIALALTSTLFAQDFRSLIIDASFSGNANDASGFGNVGSVYGAQLTTDRFGNAESAYFFDGINDWISFGIVDELLATEDFSISVWAKGTSATDAITAIIGYTSFYAGEGMYPIGIGLDDGDVLGLYVFGETSHYAEQLNISTSPEDWNHYVLTYQSGEIIRFYRNGHLLKEITDNVPFYLKKVENEFIAGASSARMGRNFFEGAIDDIKVYRKAIDKEMISTLYHAGDWDVNTGNIPTEGLVAYYPFSGSAVDESGNGHNGSLFGVTLATDRFGGLHSAYSFDGYRDYIDIGGIEDSVLEDEVTFSVWAKGVSAEASITAFIGQSSVGFPFNFGIDDGDRLQFRVDSGEGYSLMLLDEIRTQPDEWIHYVAIFKASEYMEIYRNGVLLQRSTINIADSFKLSEDPLWIGARINSEDSNRIYSFLGELDDIRIYNSALSNEEIQSLYHEGGWDENSENIPTEGLVAYYPFSGSADDYSNGGHNAAVFGAVLTEDRFGNQNSAYEFDGYNDYLYATTKLDYAERTVSVWVKSDFADSTGIKKDGQHILSYEHMGLLNGSFGLALNDGWFKFKEGDSEPPWYQGVEINTWYHLVMVKKNTVVTGYVNGNKVGTGLADNTSSTFYEPEDLHIGTTRVFDRYFDGVIDDIRIYNSALSDEEIQSLYHEGGWDENSENIPTEGLVAYYPFSGSADDESGNGNDGGVFGATLIEDRFGNPNSSYFFDGNDYIDTFTSFDFPIRTTSIWFRVDSGNLENLAEQNIFDQDDYYNLNHGVVRLSIDNDRFSMLEGDNGGRVNLYEVVEPSVWYHAAMVRGVDSVRYYFNGKKVGETIKGYLASKSYAYPNLVIGSYRGRSKKFFYGAIDDIRIYNRALSEKEVLALYNESNSAPNGLPTDGQTVGNENEEEYPTEIKLYQNYPNPFNPSTTIKFDLPNQQFVTLQVFDSAGRLIQNLVQGQLNAGKYSVTFDASRLASGVYVYKLETNKYVASKAFTLIK